MLKVVKRIAPKLAVSKVIEKEGGRPIDIGEAAPAERTDPPSDGCEECIDVVRRFVQLFRVGQAVVVGDDY